MIVSSTTFSQGLKPIVQRINNDTLFCFTLPQAKDIARRIVKAEYSDSIIQHLERENEVLVAVIVKKDSIIRLVEANSKLVEAINVNQEALIIGQQDALKEKKKEVRRAKRQKAVLSTVLVVVSILAVL
jgi:hypothetical protein